MSDRVFIDTNILVYSYSNSEPLKQAVARKLITDNNSYISTQVLQELVNTVTRKFKFTFQDAANALSECCQNNILYTNTQNTIQQACKVAQLHNYTFYDSLIIAAALDCNCSVLYSEDLSHKQIILGKVSIINPFID
jgi:predicted nucleic acid-binding protein